jgi:outer membrane immunogenic protein
MAWKSAIASTSGGPETLSAVGKKCNLASVQGWGSLMNIRAFLMAAAFGGLALSAAQAADQSATAPRPPYYPDTYSPNTYYPVATMWTGPYAGLHIGGVFGSSSWTDPNSGLGDTSTGSGVLGGAQIGVNGQMDWLVYGLEADFSGMDLSGSGGDAAGFTHTFHAPWLSTVTGRVGYATGAWLFYAKGGAAFTDERDNVITPTGTVLVGVSHVEPGWTVGGGTEYALTHNWSVRLEYDYMNFNNRIPTVFPPPAAPSGNVDWTLQKVVGAVNYRF